jgi:hypothetical protein
MHGFSLAFSLISAFVPVPAGTADAPPPVVAQAETAPPPQPTYAPPPAEPSPYAAAPAPAASPYAAAPAPGVPAMGAAPSLQGPTIWGIYSWGGLGVGARYALPIYGSVLHHPTLRDNFELEFGGDFVHRSFDVGLGYGYSWTIIRVAAGVMWDIWVNDQFAFYPKIELGYNHYSYSFDNGYNYTGNDSPLYFNGAAGILYKINGGLTLRAELGNAALYGGVAWLF